MGSRKKFFVAEKKVQKAFDAMGKIARCVECLCSTGIDIYVAGEFIRIGS